MSVFRIYLLRHGEIDTTFSGKFVGQMDLSLSVTGQIQAGFWKRELATIPLKTIFCSDLARSRDTATIISGSRKIDIRVTPQLREICLGKWEGMEISYVKTHFPEDWRLRGMDIEKYRPPGGESFSDLSFRVLPIFNQVVANLQGDVLIAGHAGVNRIVLCHLLGMPLTNALIICQDYGRMNIIEVRDGSFSLRAMNILPGGSNI